MDTGNHKLQVYWENKTNRLQDMMDHCGLDTKQYHRVFSQKITHFCHMEWSVDNIE